MNQRQALALLEAGHNVLLTGAAGSGKTYVLQKFIDRSRSKGKTIAVTATTGLAATHLGGTTIHSWSGIGVHDQLNPYLLGALSKTRIETIRSAQTLVIDEISMLHDYRLDMLNELLKNIRKSERPFGGLQLVLCGDFFQLPPINRQGGRQGGFVVSSRSWQDAQMTICYLHGSQRQKDDADFAAFLQSMRRGNVTEVQYERLMERMNAFRDPFEIVTKLYTTNADVDSINNAELKKMDGKAYSYHMETTGKKQYVDTLKKSCLAQEVLTLKVGASVMCIKNAADKKYVNGSLGTVVAFAPHTNYPIIVLKNGDEVAIKPETWELTDGDVRRAQVSQLPLRLAWAITVHKSQGMTLDGAEVDLSRAFTPGMGYVALSRVRNLLSLYLAGINAMAMRVSDEALAIEEYLQSQSAHACRAYAEVFEFAEDKWKREREASTPLTTNKHKVNGNGKNTDNAYKPWKKQDDTLLVSMHDDGVKTKEMAMHFQRQPSAIRARLKKLLETRG